MCQVWILLQLPSLTVPEKYYQPTTIAVEHPSWGKMAIDVYGQQIEPICNYRTCSHKFSTHGHSSVHVNAVTLSIMLLECHSNQFSRQQKQ
jgi:hypothetical protein